MRDALRAVREALGPSALVLATRTVPARGVRGWCGAREVEITAAADRAPVSVDRHSGDRAARQIAARLQASGFDGGTARRLAAAIPAAFRRGAGAGALQRTLAAELDALAARDESYAPVEVFVGPPGVGKTTTIAKIAAAERARRGTRLGVLAADGFRVGAVEQLRLFADIIGAPFAIARSADELEAALARARRPLLLDTAGRSPNDAASQAMFRVLARCRDVRTHLVLPAATTPAAARRAIERFRDARPSRLVLTRLDESESLAPLLGVVRDSGLPVSYLGTGQNVPEDLERATGTALASWVTGEDARAGAVA